VTAEPGGRELSGRELARELRAGVAARAAELAAGGCQPRLAAVTANDDGGSAAYVRSLANAAGTPP
jgi:methylenetetrahydrofolate dehydrogenase (NADP+)/methenyltetrahydrofolate cyclohydrolase